MVDSNSLVRETLLWARRGWAVSFPPEGETRYDALMVRETAQGFGEIVFVRLNGDGSLSQCHPEDWQDAPG